MLGRGLALNDELQRALAKYDAIVSGSQTPSAFTSGSPNNFAVYDQEDSETEHDFSQLARRCASCFHIDDLWNHCSSYYIQ